MLLGSDWLMCWKALVALICRQGGFFRIQWITSGSLSLSKPITGSQHAPDHSLFASLSWISDWIV